VLGDVPGFRWLPGLLLVMGAVLFASQAVRRIWPGVRLIRLPFALPGAARIAALARRIDPANARTGFLLGVVLGFLPCGFLYAALAMAAAAPGAGLGAVAMVAFGLGTAPGLMVVGALGQAGFRHFTRAMAFAGPAVLLGNSAMLLLLAWQRLILAGVAP
jgi:sulfite exporter TauE/SafE